MTAIIKFENSKVGILACNIIFASTFEEVNYFRNRYFPETIKPIIALRYYDGGESNKVYACTSPNDILDLLTQEIEIERVLQEAGGRKLTRPEITLESRHKPYEEDHFEEKYTFSGIPHVMDFRDCLAHGLYTNATFLSPSGSSRVSLGIGITSEDYLKGSVNYFSQFQSLSNFYDFNLAQQTCNLPEVEDQARYRAFFERTSMDEVNALFGESMLWRNLKESLKPSNIFSLDQIKSRIREFERDFFPGEFEKGARGIKQTMDWLRSLKE